MKIGVIGVGVVGGATAEVFGKVHEMYLYDKFKEDYSSGRNLQDLAVNAEVVFICVSTPMQPETGEIDCSGLEDSLDALWKATLEAKRKPEELLIVIRSTAVSGTTDRLDEVYPFKFVFNPEFLRDRYAVEDMENTNRVVVGASDQTTGKILVDVYRSCFPGIPAYVVDRRTAEMVKYAANVFLAFQIAMANEIRNICVALNIDYDVVKDIVLEDKRIGRNIEVPGPDGDYGFGGKCFPKDANALKVLAEEHGYAPKLLAEMWELNLRVRKNRDWEK